MCVSVAYIEFTDSNIASYDGVVYAERQRKATITPDLVLVTILTPHVRPFRERNPATVHCTFAGLHYRAE